jgi:hypothetical protein
MGTLALYLQRAFESQCPSGWICRREVRLLPLELQKMMGYSPRADVLLERNDGSRRLWVEFEVSRADPVANHAKFATAHLFLPQISTDAFVSMVSSHVNRGRRNLAANTISVMRHIGMNAFQTVLLPHVSALEIKRLNHLDLHSILSEHLAIEDEINRALSVSEVVPTSSGHRIHLVGDMIEVLLNLRRWNQDLSTSEGQSLWKRRTVTYFVYDPFSKNFAPSKFCAYVVMPPARYVSVSKLTMAEKTEMSVSLYVTLDEADKCFDGHRARTHLTQSLAMPTHTANEVPEVPSLFDNWLSRHAENIKVHPKGPIFLFLPQWASESQQVL